MQCRFRSPCRCMCKCMCTLLAVIRGVVHLHHTLCPAITHSLVCLQCVSFFFFIAYWRPPAKTLSSPSSSLARRPREGGVRKMSPFLSSSQPGSTCRDPRHCCHQRNPFYLAGTLEVSLEYHHSLSSPLGPAHVQGRRRRSGPAPLVRLPRRSSGPVFRSPSCIRR